MSEIHDTQQRFLTLKVDEVSIVDNPANEEEWLVIKRLEGKMPEKQEANNTEAQKETQVEKKTEPEKTEPEKTEKTVEKKVELNEAMMVDLLKKVLEPHFKDKDVEKQLNPVQAMGLLKKVWKLLEPFFKGGTTKSAEAEKEAEKEKEKETKKTLLHFSDDGSVILDLDGLQEVSKAKQFTGKRIEKIAGAITALIEMMKEVSPDSAQKVMAAFSGLPTPMVGIQKDNPEMKKEETPKEETPKVDIAEIVQKAITDAVAPISERLEKLENIRGVKKSVEAEAETETTPVEKSDNVWEGVF
jgi:hypothetical protein